MASHDSRRAGGNYTAGDAAPYDPGNRRKEARANVKTVVLTHLTYRPDGDYTARAAEVKKYFSGEVLTAKDLMEF